MTNELSQRVVAINRVTKVVKGGRNFSFSALVVTGDGKGRVGIGKGKAGEVPESISKAGRVAEKSLSFYHLKDNRTIPHQVTGVFGAVKVVLRPAGPGTGLIAGGPVRSVLECVGVKDILSKRIGSRNPHNLVKATVNALSQLMDKSATSSEAHKKDEKASLKNSKSLDKNKDLQENAPQQKRTELSQKNQVSPSAEEDKTQHKKKTELSQKNQASSSAEENQAQQHELLRQKMIKTFEKLKNINLIRKSDNLWFSDNEKVKLCVMTSKAYPSSSTQKYWFTLTEKGESFLEHSQESYVFLGFLDNDQSVYLIPYFDYKNNFLSCDTTDRGRHIRINQDLKWYFPNNNPPKIDLLKFKVSLTSLEKSPAEYKSKFKTDRPSSKSKKNMDWTKLQEMKVFLIYKQIQEGGNEKDLCQKLKQKDKTFTCSLDSIKMKIRNIESLYEGKGLENVSSKNKEVFKKYKDHSIEKLKEEIKEVEETDNA